MASKKDKYYQRSDGLFEAIRMVDGKRKAFRGHSAKEVEQKMIAYQGQLQVGPLFKTVSDEWERVHFPTLAANTLRGYKPALARAIEYFSDTAIRQIRAPDIKGFIQSFARTGHAQKTVANQRLIINLVMGFAVESGYLDINPCQSVTIPKGLKRGHRMPASAEDEQKIKSTADIWLFPFLLLYTGLRRGEAMGLTWGDIDLKSNEIIVSKSVYYQDGVAKVKLPKTAAGVRRVPLLEPLRKQIGKLGPKKEYIFSADGGQTPYTQSQVLVRWRQYARATGVTATPHQIRHSYATTLLECGIEAKDAQYLLGHSTVAMTQDVYTHIRDNRRKETANKLRNFLSEESTQNTEPTRQSTN